jgi:hypothetical protein
LEQIEWKDKLKEDKFKERESQHTEFIEKLTEERTYHKLLFAAEKEMEVGFDIIYDLA